MRRARIACHGYEASPTCLLLTARFSTARQEFQNADGMQVSEGEPVAIYAEGKKHAMAIGITNMFAVDS